MTLVDQTPDPRCASKPRNTFPSNSIYPPGADHVGREDSACQKQFNPGDETYRCIDCEITDDTPGTEFISYQK